MHTMKKQRNKSLVNKYLLKKLKSGNNNKIYDEYTKFYNKKSRGIIDLSLSIEEGEMFGFIGPNCI